MTFRGMNLLTYLSLSLAKLNAELVAGSLGTVDEFELLTEFIELLSNL
jgi:hypothetical protein